MQRPEAVGGGGEAAAINLTGAQGRRYLRGEHRAEEAVELGAMPDVLDRVRGDTLEIIAEFGRGDAESFGLKVCRSATASAH